MSPLSLFWNWVQFQVLNRHRVNTQTPVGRAQAGITPKTVSLQGNCSKQWTTVLSQVYSCIKNPQFYTSPETLSFAKTICMHMIKYKHINMYSICYVYVLPLVNCHDLHVLDLRYK